MLFDKNLTVPDIARAVQLEERPRQKVANPYNTLDLRKQAKEKKVVDKKPAQVWEPHVQVGKKVASIPQPASSMSDDPAPLQDSAAIPAAPSRRRKV